MTSQTAYSKIDWLFRSKEHEGKTFEEQMKYIKEVLDKLQNDAFDRGQVCGITKAKEHMDFLVNEIKSYDDE